MALNLARIELLNLALNLDRRRNLRRQRVIRDRSKAFELSDINFRRLFRLEKLIVIELIEELRRPLSGRRNTKLPVDCQVLIALRFFAVGSYQMCIGQDIYLGVSQPTVSRVLKNVTRTILNVLSEKWVRFPTTEIQRVANKIRFMEKTNFPGVIGAIDCTHIAIVPPAKVNGENREYLYVNRKGYHSINVQLVKQKLCNTPHPKIYLNNITSIKICDYDLVILQANAKFPGSAHDTYIYKTSAICSYLERKFQDGSLKGSWILGDGGYPLLPWLITPISKPAAGSPEEMFSLCQQSARSVIERCNGVLKQRFRCLLKDRTLHYVAGKAADIINACIVLHNICILRGVTDDYNELDPLEDGEYGPNDQLWVDNEPWEEVAAPTAHVVDKWKVSGQQTREQIIRRRFT